MSDLALSLIRAGVQTVWGFLAALAIAHGIGLSRTAPEWAVQAVTAGVMLAAVAALRYVEQRWPNVGRWLMATIQAVPRYVRPVSLTTATAPSMARVRDLTRETQTGGSTTPPTTTPPAA